MQILTFLLVGLALGAAPPPKVVVTGRVFDAKTREPIAYAPVAASRLTSAADSVGTPSGGVASTEAGAFVLSLEPGLYDLRVTYFSYETFLAHALSAQGDTLRIDFPLVEEVVQLQNVDILGSRITKTQTLLTEQREAESVSDGISSDEIKKSTDSNAAEAITRVTGLSVVGGKYAFVRGLGERYSQTQVNGVTIGSPEPNKRVIPLDLFAAGLLDRIVVRKTYTPDQPGEFAGGVVDIGTQDFPGARTWGLSGSAGHAASTTGYRFATYEGDNTDWLGIDGGARGYPQLFREIALHKRVVSSGVFDTTGQGFQSDEIRALGRSFNKTWTPSHTVAKPNAQFQGSFADGLQLLGRNLGFLASASYSNGYDDRTHKSRTVFASSTDESGQEVLALKTDYDVHTSERKVLWGALASANYAVAPRVTLRLRSMYNRSAEDEVRTYEGYNEDLGTNLRITRLKYVERGLSSSTAELEHPVPFLSGSSLLWRYGRSSAERNEPDRREFTYEYSNSDSTWYLSSHDRNLTRLFGETRDEEWTTEAKLRVPITAGRASCSDEGREGRREGMTLTTGWLRKEKERNTGYRRFYYSLPRFGVFSTQPESLLVDANIGGSARSFKFGESTRSDDAYIGSHDVTATFAMADVPVTARLRLIGGVRWEHSKQLVDSHSPFEVEADTSSVKARLDNDDPLPSLNLVYQLGERMNLRAALSRTVARPDLRELSKMYFTDYRSGNSETGNPNLVRSRISNYDLRWESYPGAVALMALSAFYKRLEDPIEISVQGGQDRVYAPFNGEEGYVYGAEAEARLGLGRFARALDWIGFSSNVTIVQSHTKIGATGGVETSKERPLWGQSPYIVNLGLYFATDAEVTSATLLYNVAGKRLAYVGSYGLPDIYEQPRHSLDLKFSLGRGRVKVGFENILDTKIVFEQKDFVTDSERPGRTASVTFALKS